MFDSYLWTNHETKADSVCYSRCLFLTAKTTSLFFDERVKTLPFQLIISHLNLSCSKLFQLIWRELVRTFALNQWPEWKREWFKIAKNIKDLKVRLAFTLNFWFCKFKLTLNWNCDNSLPFSSKKFPITIVKKLK